MTTTTKRRRRRWAYLPLSCARWWIGLGWVGYGWGWLVRERDLLDCRVVLCVGVLKVPFAPPPPHHYHHPHNAPVMFSGQDDIPVELGFLEPLAEDSAPHLEPGDEEGWDGGKAGGRPVWLSPGPPPDRSAVVCGSCSGPLRLLVQVYAPVDDVPAAFHRELYLLLCRSPECLKKGGYVGLDCHLNMRRGHVCRAHARLLDCFVVCCAGWWLCGVSEPRTWPPQALPRRSWGQGQRRGALVPPPPPCALSVGCLAGTGAASAT